MYDPPDDFTDRNTDLVRLKKVLYERQEQELNGHCGVLLSKERVKNGQLAVTLDGFAKPVLVLPSSIEKLQNVLLAT